MNTKNTIDVIIPAYNQGRYILDAISSIENQTFKVNHVFIINDGSTDNTEDIVNSYIKESKIPITYIKKDNGGPNSARNMGLHNSNAEFVAFLDADDVWDKDKLEKQLRVFNNTKYNKLGLVYGKYDLIDSNGIKILGGYIVNLDPNLKGSAYNILSKGNKILGSASNVLIKKEVFDEVGYFDEKLRFAEDWDMWLRIAREYEVDYVDDILVHIRKHSHNNSKNIIKKIKGKIQFFIKRILERYAK